MHRRCSVVQCGAVCCSVLHCGAVCCTVLQCVAVCCTVLHCVAVAQESWGCVIIISLTKQTQDAHKDGLGACFEKNRHGSQSCVPTYSTPGKHTVNICIPESEINSS